MWSAKIAHIFGKHSLAGFWLAQSVCIKWRLPHFTQMDSANFVGTLVDS